MSIEHNTYIRWQLILLCAHPEFRFAEGIWLHRKSRQIRFFSEKTIFSGSELPSYIKYHGTDGPAFLRKCIHKHALTLNPQLDGISAYSVHI